MTVTDIRDAKAFRAMGVPLNSPVIDGGELPAPATKAMVGGYKAAIAFRKCIYAYTDKPSASTQAAMWRAFHRFMAKTASDDRLGAAILDSEFGKVRAEWADLFDRWRAGETCFEISGMWPFVPTEATKMRQRTGDVTR
jgi:hypothetical protein